MDSFLQHTVNIRSPRWLLAQTVGVCPHCGASTQLFAIGLPPGHESIRFDESLDGEGQGTWEVENQNAFLFHVESLSAAIRCRLKSLVPCFRPDRCGPADDVHWLNHCERCGCALDDVELFCEPEGAFSPISESVAGLIRLLPIEAALEAAVAGYAYEPEFFAAMGLGWG